MDEPPYRLSRILTETYAAPPSRGGACNRRATRTLDGHVNVLTVSVLLPKQVWRRLPTRTNRLLVEPRATSLAERPSGLLESELFGHERGAFTGELASHLDRFALADRGTFFVDEIGDMSLDLRPKLLRVLQEREFEAVGSTRTTRVDVRVVTATNRDLRQMVHDREFREDLYYRLNIFPISLPPLRERKADIPEFVRNFVQHYADSMEKTIDSIPEETMRSLVRHPWPGNIRELQNYIARGVILSTDGLFHSAPPEKSEPLPPDISNPTLEDKVRREILAACQRANGKLRGARRGAARLGPETYDSFLQDEAARESRLLRTIRRTELPAIGRLLTYSVGHSR